MEVFILTFFVPFTLISDYHSEVIWERLVIYNCRS